MIKIIKEGKLEQYRAICPNCGCVFEFDKIDMEEEITRTELFISSKQYIKCSCCHKLVYKDNMELIK